MHTPFFPAFRPRFAALGRRIQHLRQQSLCHLELLLHPFLPPGLLSQADEGPNSRDRAYNLRRTFFGFLYQDVALDRMSFKGTVDSVRQFSLAIAQARSKKKQQQLIAELLEVIARDQVPDRPGRLEPRATKRRPKPYDRLNRPRHLMKEIRHRNHYRKNS